MVCVFNFWYAMLFPLGASWWTRICVREMPCGKSSQSQISCCAGIMLCRYVYICNFHIVNILKMYQNYLMSLLSGCCSLAFKDRLWSEWTIKY